MKTNQLTTDLASPAIVPEDALEIDQGMSNFDLSIDEGCAEKLQSGNFFTRHTAWNFNAKVIWREGKFHSEVWCYGSIAGNYQADTLEDLMQIHDEQYGED